MKIQEIYQITRLPILFASLCCLSPLVLVMLGLSTVSFATGLADTLYGQYKWYFRIVGLITLGISLHLYFKKKNICTLDAVKRRKNEVINTLLLSIIVAILGYVFWLYVVVHYVGVWYDVWK